MTRTKKQLENLLLAKALKRFKRTNLEKVEQNKLRDNEWYKSEEYILEVNKFKFKLYFCKDLEKDLENGHLWVLNPQGYIFESFDLSNKSYAPILKNMYEIITKRIEDSQEKKKIKDEKEFNRNLRRLDRRL